MRYPGYVLVGLAALVAVVAAGVLWNAPGGATETYLGTDPASDCGPVSATDAWPPDFDQSGTVDILDFVALAPPVFGSRVGDLNFSPRLDLNWDGINGVLDFAHLQTPMFLDTCPLPYVPPAAAGNINEIAIDMDTTGNNARLTSGTNIQNCGEINSGGTNTIDIDVIIPSPGVHASDGIEVWEFLLNYDPAVVSISAEDQNYLLTQAAGSSLNDQSDALPDAGGSWRSGAIDSPGSTGPEPGGTHEVGPGVLTRITLTGVAQGTTALTLTKAGAMTAANKTINIIDIVQATVSVDEVCVPIPPPAPGPLTSTATISVGDGPDRGLAVNPSTNQIYVNNRLGGSVTVIDADTDAVTTTISGLGTEPNGIDVNPVTNRVYTAIQGNGVVKVIDGTTDTVSATITVGSVP
jgi:YVTN family beta-propeller protein